MAYFLKHWSEIKKSETMMQIWQQIRHGKHVGFEEGMFRFSRSTILYMSRDLVPMSEGEGVKLIVQCGR